MVRLPDNVVRGEKPLNDEGWSDEVGGGGRAPFFPLSKVPNGGIVKVRVLEDPKDPQDADSEFVREKNGWEAVCECNGREATLSIANRAVAEWLRQNQVVAGHRFEMLAVGEALDRRWRLRRVKA